MMSMKLLAKLCVMLMVANVIDADTAFIMIFLINCTFIYYAFISDLRIHVIVSCPQENQSKQGPVSI